MGVSSAQHALELNLSLERDRIAAAPSPGTLSARSSTERARVHLVADVRAIAAGIERDRPPLSIVFAIDCSASMAGPPIEHVIRSLERLVGLLEPTDRVGLVAFADGAMTVVPLSPLDAETRRLVQRRAQRLFAEGCTNVEEGLRRSSAMFTERRPHERQVVLLLSDGAPNRGLSSATELAAIAKSMRPNICVATLGYGEHHQEDVLSAIAEAGGGRYQFIAEPSVCDLEFAQAIGTQGDVVAEGVELTLTPAPGVEIARFIGKVEARFGAGGLTIPLPDLLEGAQQLTVAELRLTAPREAGSWEIMRASLSYRRAGERVVQRIEGRIAIGVGSGGEDALVPEAHARVLRVRADEARAEARAIADRGQWDGAAAVLRALMKAIEAAPGFRAGAESPLNEAYEQLVDEVAALERRPSPENYKAFRRATMSMRFVTAGPQQSGPQSASPQSRHMMESVAGRYPKAWLEVVRGPGKGKRYPLGTRQVLGRTSMADISIADPAVSRQHAQVVAQRGKFLVMDLGSSNPTIVNGDTVTAPRELAQGDRIEVGGALLVYVEEENG